MELVTVFVLLMLGAPKQQYPFIFNVYSTKEMCEHYKGGLEKKLSAQNVTFECKPFQTTPDVINVVEQDEV